MKKLLINIVCAFCIAFSVLAVEDTVTVRASVEATMANSRAKNECIIKAKKLAVEKYLGSLDSGMAETLVKRAVQDYKKYIDEVEADEGDFEDGEFSCEYQVTIKREELMQWLSSEGWSMAAGATDASGNPVEVELVVAEDPPDVGAMKVADAFGTGLDGELFFFTRYTEFQKTIRDVLVDKLNKLGMQVPLLEDNPAYEELKEQDPCCMGVYFDAGVGEKGDFKVTPNYIKLIQSNNPDSMVLLYRVGSLVYENRQSKVFVSVSLAIKNLVNNKTIQIGRTDYESPTIISRQKDRIMMEMATTVGRATAKILSAEDAGAKIMNAIKTLKAEAAKPKGPMKVVFNMSKVDKKIRTKAKVMLKRGLIAAGLTDQSSVKTVGDTLTMTVTKKDIPDMDELWMTLAEVLMSDEVGIGEVTDDQMSVNGNTMTVTPGKETSED